MSKARRRRKLNARIAHYRDVYGWVVPARKKAAA